MPISRFQSSVLRLLAAQRSPDSYIAGGIAINRQGPRFSDDIDIFHDSAARQEGAVRADLLALDVFRHDGFRCLPRGISAGVGGVRVSPRSRNETGAWRLAMVG